VIAVDTNILIYAHRAESPHHQPAEISIRSLAEGSSPWAIPWPCVHEFLAIVTRARIYDPPTPLGIALRQVDTWLGSPGLALLSESADHWRELRAIATAGNIIGPRIHDAHIAAICRQHGVRELWSADRDFSRFPGLKVVNPLIG
jgi:toxin-antitoxin system PIN domain toxin